MKLGKSALLEIVAIVQDGLVNGKDISQSLRELDLVEKVGSLMIPSETEDLGKLVLSSEYVASHPRASDWDEPDAGEE